MLSNEFKYNPSMVNSKKKRIGSEEVATSPLRIIFPERYLDGPLTVLGEVVYIVGYFAVIDESNNYSICSLPAMIRTEPDRITTTTVDDVPYCTFHYDVGSRLVANINLVIDDNLPHKIYTELLALGRIPFYFNYESVYRFFLETKKYNGYELGSNSVLWEYLAATISRDPNDPSRLYRNRKDIGDRTKRPVPTFIGLNNVAMGATDAFNRQGGSYAREGLTATLADPSTRAERMESILRMN